MSMMDGANATASPAQQAQAPDAAALAAEVERLRRDYAASSTEAKRLKAERDAFEAQFQAVFRPQQQADPYQQLRDYNIPTEAVTEVVRREIQQQFAPITRGIQARGQVLQEYPDYQKFESDVANYLGSDPVLQKDYNELFVANPARAMEWAFHKFGESQRKAQAQQQGGNTNRQQRSDAQIPSSRSGETRSKGEDNSGDVTARAYAEWRKTGNPAARDAFVKSRLSNVISDDFFKSK